MPAPTAASDSRVRDFVVVSVVYASNDARLVVGTLERTTGKHYEEAKEFTEKAYTALI